VNFKFKPQKQHPVNDNTPGASYSLSWYQQELVKRNEAPIQTYPCGDDSWLVLWSYIFTFSSKFRDLRSIKKMMVFIAKKLLLDREITSLELNTFKDQSKTQIVGIKH